MPNSLLPELNGRRLTVDVALRNPNLIRARIAKLADDQIVLPKLFHGLGAPVQGGGMLYSVIQASDFYSTDVEQRTPLNEYRVIEGVDPDPKIATVEDWGGKFAVSDEARSRNDTNYLDQQVTQLANTIAKRLDTAAIAAVEAAVAAGDIKTVTGHNWNALVLVGPENTLTPSGGRPPADFADAQLLADLEELGAVHDTLLVHPNQARALKVAYGEDLESMLKSAGLKMFSNPRIAAGTAYAIKGGEVGTVGFEAPLTTDVWDDRSVRGQWVQSYVVPALAVDKPYAAKKLIALQP